MLLLLLPLTALVVVLLPPLTALVVVLLPPLTALVVLVPLVVVLPLLLTLLVVLPGLLSWLEHEQRVPLDHSHRSFSCPTFAAPQHRVMHLSLRLTLEVAQPPLGL